MTDGFCECGCGKRTRIATQTKPRLGHVKGQPVRFIKGHNCRGRKASLETRAKISAAKRGHKTSLEARAKISAALRGPRHHHWKGGRSKDSNGYIIVQIHPDHPFAAMRAARGHVREHRLVLAESLGRPLTEDEVAHHMNEIKDDNRLENLELFESGAAHMSHHRKLGKAV